MVQEGGRGGRRAFEDGELVEAFLAPSLVRCIVGKAHFHPTLPHPLPASIPAPPIALCLRHAFLPSLHQRHSAGSCR